MPRSGRRTSYVILLGSRGFNEAGAIMPRSGQWFPRGMRIAPIEASMRPGQSCPGVGPSAAPCGGEAPINVLQ